jgi:hypothetical protein
MILKHPEPNQTFIFLSTSKRFCASCCLCCSFGYASGSLGIFLRCNPLWFSLDPVEVASLPGHRKSRQVGDAIYGLKIHALVAIKAGGGPRGPHWDRGGPGHPGSCSRFRTTHIRVAVWATKFWASMSGIIISSKKRWNIQILAKLC